MGPPLAGGLGRGVAGLAGVGTGFRERFWGQALGTTYRFPLKDGDPVAAGC